MTVVLHGLWLAGPSRLWLWGEDAERARAPVSRRGRLPGSARPRSHPFAAVEEQLRDAVGDLAPGPGSDPKMSARLTLLLPGSGGRPQASPQVLSHPDAGAGLGAGPPAPWRVPAVGFGPGQAIDVLLSLADAGGAAPARVGDSVRWLSRAVELGLELVARGRVLPAVVPDGEARAEARWRPVLGEADTTRLRELAASMPAACRAHPRSGPVLRDLVEATVDAAARSSLAGRSLVRARRGRRPARPPTAAEAWVEALSAPDPGFAADASELTKLATLVQEWADSAALSAGPVRTCLRLEPPAGVEDGAESGAEADPALAGAAGGSGHAGESGGAPALEAGLWRLELALQAVEDPSLVVPAADVWASEGALSVLDGVVADPQERLLEGLGRVSRLYPVLERALGQARPEALELTLEEAASFLRETVPLLEQAGFGVLVPPWWRRSRLGLRLKARTRKPAAETSGLLGMDGICDYRWEVALGDQSLSAADLRRLARLKQPLVRVKGQWVEIGADEVAAALAVLADGGRRSGEMAASGVLRAALGLGTPAPGDLPILGVEADGWLGELLDGALDRRLEPVPTPLDFAGVLRPYQERGLAWLSFLASLGLGACLADDMGLGKTAQLLALLVAEREPGAGAQARVGGGRGRRRPHLEPHLAPTLVVCPMSLVGNWQREAERFAPGLRVHVHHGAGRLSGADFAARAGSCDLVLTTYALAARDVEVLSSLSWGRVVLDEAQNIKNSQARQTRAVRLLPARHRVAMTGTPVENRLGELWSIMQFLNPGLLGSEAAFRERFAVPVERYGDEQAAATLRRITAPFVLRRLKTDKSIIADLPDKWEMKVYCNLTREQATLYQAVVDDMLARIEETAGIERRGLVLATMMKLKQVCNHPVQLLGDGSRVEGRSGKLARLTETLEEIVAEGDRALVFTQFAEMGTMLAGHLRDRLGREVAWLHGGVSKRARDEMVARFQSEDGGGPPVFLLSLKAGGTGLNLTGANHVIHFDRWWNPAVEDQATDRAFRIGQRRNVQVRKLVCVGTLEERIDAMIESKRALAERIVGSGEGWLTELSTDALREVVALSADAVAEG